MNRLLCSAESFLHINAVSITRLNRLLSKKINDKSKKTQPTTQTQNKIKENKTTHVILLWFPDHFNMIIEYKILQ